MDQLDGVVDVVGGFWVEVDVGGIGFGEVWNDVVYWFYYQVYVDWCGDVVFVQCLVDYWVDGQVGYVMVVYYIEMYLVCIGGEYVVYFFVQVGEVCGQDGGGDDVVGYGWGFQDVDGEVLCGVSVCVGF